MISPHTTYIVPWYNCNLKCPHCDVRQDKYDGDFEKFLNALKILTKDENDIFVLFGGEPLLKTEEFVSIMNTKLIDTVSTNMLLWKPDYSPLFLVNNTSIATSYNPERFSGDNFVLWLNNLHNARNSGIDILLLITLTESLFNMPLQSFINTLNLIQTTGVYRFLFEPYIGEKECNDLADEWLIKFHEQYLKQQNPMESLIINNLFNWSCNCSTTKTLTPQGELKKGCPQFKVTPVPSECLQCELNSICQPCPIQKTCSYPKKFASWIIPPSLGSTFYKIGR